MGFKLDWSFETFCANAHSTQDGLKLAIYAKFPKLFEKEPKWDVLKGEKQNIYVDLVKSSKIEMMPGVVDLLKILNEKNKRRCVVTNSIKEEIGVIIHQQEILKTIPHWITRESYLKPKPSSECYLKAISLHSKKGDRIVGFEDSIRGIRALLNTPAKAVFVGKAHHPQLETIMPKGALYFESFKDIESL